MKKQHWQDWVNLLLGIWLLLAPLAIERGASGAVIPNFYFVGIALIIFAVVALVAFRLWEEWVNVILGAWLLVSPWLLGFSTVTALMSNAVLIGALIILCAGWVLKQEHGGKPVAK